MNFDGGRGSCLAVTAQSLGPDGRLLTADDIFEARLNEEPAFVSADMEPALGVPGTLDRVRPFIGPHPGGAVFVNADGSTHFVNEKIDREEYILQSHIRDGR